MLGVCVGFDLGAGLEMHTSSDRCLGATGLVSAPCGASIHIPPPPAAPPTGPASCSLPLLQVLSPRAALVSVSASWPRCSVLPCPSQAQAQSCALGFFLQGHWALFCPLS